MNSTIVTIICAVLASNALFGFIQFAITRKDTKKNYEGRLKSFDKALKLLEKDILRTQLLVLIVLKPEESQEILTIAEHYFKDLNGNWYMTSIFNKWLIDQDIASPDWFDN